MKLTKAELRGDSVYLRCECMDRVGIDGNVLEIQPDTVWTIDSTTWQGGATERNIQQVVREFALLHSHPPAREERKLEFEGRDLGSLLR